MSWSSIWNWMNDSQPVSKPWPNRSLVTRKQHDHWGSAAFYVAIKAELQRRKHRRTTEAGAWLRKVVRRYYQSLGRRVSWLWRSVLVRRSQCARRDGMVRAVCVNALVRFLREAISDGRRTATTILPFVCKVPP
jgi:hypothetical protein